MVSILQAINKQMYAFNEEMHIIKNVGPTVSDFALSEEAIFYFLLLKNAYKLRKIGNV